MTVRQKLEVVREAMDRAARRAGRSPADVRLVAASKTVSPAQMLEAAQAGVTVFGENRVQEAVDKKLNQAWPDGTVWHFIGHLQRNKVRVAVSTFDMIESVHSIALAQAIDRHSRELGVRMPVLMEINIGGETTKTGWAPEEAVKAARTIGTLSSLKLQGLMTVPPWRDKPDEVRPFFIRLRQLLEEINREGFHLSELSMGMSHDFDVAIEEGATIVRVGTAIFGKRPAEGVSPHSHTTRTSHTSHTRMS